MIINDDNGNESAQRLTFQRHIHIVPILNLQNLHTH